MNAILLSLLLLVTLPVGVMSEGRDYDITAEEFEIIEVVREIRSQSLYDGLNSEELKKQIAIGTLSTLGDEYYDVKTAAEGILDDYISDDRCDLGLTIDAIDYNGGKELRVLDVMTNSSGLVAGFKPGDIIYEVNGIRTKGSPEIFDAALELVYFDELSDFKIIRNGAEKDLECKRIFYKPPAVEASVLEDNIYYIDINYFDWDTKDELEKELNKFRDFKFDKLIIDLRNNLGGDIDATVEAAALISHYAVPAYIFKPKSFEQISRNFSPIIDEIAPVVLISEGTASSAELFAGIMKEQCSATLIGRETYGKDIGQEFFDIKGLKVKMTTLSFSAKVSDLNKHLKIKPDIYVEEPLYSDRGDEILSRAIEALNDNEN